LPTRAARRPYVSEMMPHIGSASRPHSDCTLSEPSAAH
jgi:hypothetical protein